jgi:hypothetical protein
MLIWQNFDKNFDKSSEALGFFEWNIKSKNKI